MKKVILLLMLLIQASLMLAQESNHLGNSVSMAWLKQVIEGGNKTELINKFEDLMSSTPVVHEVTATNDKDAYLDLTKLNLDDDFNDEYLLFIGAYHGTVMFYVIDDNLKIIYEEYLWLHTGYPSLNIYSAVDQHKFFSIEFLYETGTGQWLYSTKIFRLDNGKVYLVNELVSDSNEALHTGINGRIQSHNIHSENGNITLHYSYEFYMDEVTLRQLGLDEKSPPLLKKDYDFVSYIYDSTQKKLVNSSSSVSSEMEAYFFKPADDALFLKVFKKELDLLMTKGRDDQKKIIEYLRASTK